MQIVIFTFLEFEFPSKNFSLVRLVSTKLSEFFEKFRKNIVPLVAPEKGASLTRCKDAACSSISIAIKEKSTQPNINLYSETSAQRQTTCIY
jgi:hypothetical protein